MRPPGTVSSQARGRVSAAGLLRRQGLLGRVAAADGPQRVTTATRWDHYLLAGDVHRPNRVELVMTTSLSKTPACKQDPTVTKMASRFNATIAHRSGHADASRPASNTPTENHLLQDSVEYRYGRRRTRCCTTATDPRSSSAGGRAVAGDHQDLSTPTPAPWHGPTAWPGTGGLAAFLAGISDSALTFRNLDVLAQKISSVGGKPGTNQVAHPGCRRAGITACSGLASSIRPSA
jgi:hypothetical protein